MDEGVKHDANDKLTAAVNRYKRLNIQTKTITSTTTTTVLITSQVTSTISTAFAVTKDVLCVPAGWKVC